ncbi:hypothetical protein GWI33_016121 [Rhynchophorus ferrugineus]|uniref:Uncharacterized protein n=1 Tax=Rhynchophorus ferrugineus TaxID=354439 RepID=A0A834IBT0_RHYFE|nr:hypothetical protein GWI33_016121 [Rhynchophorus ferrugineus]
MPIERKKEGDIENERARPVQDDIEAPNAFEKSGCTNAEVLDPCLSYFQADSSRRDGALDVSSQKPDLEINVGYEPWPTTIDEFRVERWASLTLNLCGTDRRTTEFECIYGTPPIPTANNKEEVGSFLKLIIELLASA